MMKLLSFNINLFKDNTLEVIDLILKEDPDIICLQEVSAGLDRKVKKQFRAKRLLDNELDVLYRFKFFGPLFESYPFGFEGKYYKFGGLIQQGNYILSKCQLEEAKNIFYYDNYSQIRDWSKAMEVDYPRAFQAVKLKSSLKDFTVINLHGIWNKDKLGNENTVKQMNTICDYISELKNPVIITGTLNLLPESDSIKILESKFKNLIKLNNIDSTRPHKPEIVDYIFATDDILIKDLRIIETTMSHHYPIVMEFEC